MQSKKNIDKKIMKLLVIFETSFPKLEDENLIEFSLLQALVAYIIFVAF